MKKEFNQENLRMYAHCGKIEGTVVIYGLNLVREDAFVAETQY